MYKDIGDKLYSVIDWLTSTTKINKVYYHPKRDISQWLPAVTISPMQSDISVESNQKDIAIVPFVLRIYVENKDIATVEDKLRTIADDITDELRSNRDLDWLVDKSQFKVKRWWTDSTEPLRVCEIEAHYTQLSTF